MKKNFVVDAIINDKKRTFCVSNCYDRTLKSTAIKVAKSLFMLDDSSAINIIKQSKY